MQKEFIKDVVDTEFKYWNPGDSIFLSAPTGSGKTTFVLKTLLPYCVENGKKILYLVNRTALKNQLEQIISDEVQTRFWDSIKIETYQTIENLIHNFDFGEVYSDFYFGYRAALIDSGENPDREYFGSLFKTFGRFSNGMRNDGLKKYCGYDWIICDEAHYFMSDSTFNTYTMSSYYFIQRSLRDKVKIYMSATIDEIKHRISLDNNNLKGRCSDYYCYPIQNAFCYNNPFCKIRDYNIERNYEHVSIETVASYDQIPDLVCKGKEKWLIFVDSIDKGNELRREINNRNKESNNNRTVAFLTSKYVLDEETAYEMEIITNDSKQNADVLIATSVLDNGINLIDKELRNIIAIADTETEFIQMIGRKREDNAKVKVYLFKYSIEHFKRRYKACDKQFKEAAAYYSKLKNLMEEKGEFRYANEETKLSELYRYEKEFVKSEHKELLHRLLRGEISYKTLKSCFCEFDGEFLLNTLSLNHLDNLRAYYQNMIEKFKTMGEDAFYMEQLRWLGKTEDCLLEAKMNEFDRAKKTVVDIFESILKDESKVVIDKDVLIKKTIEMRDALATLFSSIDENKENFEKIKNIVNKTKATNVKEYVSATKKNLNKPDRPLSSVQMEVLRTFCGIPYTIYIEKDNCTISCIRDIK